MYGYARIKVFYGVKNCGSDYPSCKTVVMAPSRTSVLPREQVLSFHIYISAVCYKKWDFCGAFILTGQERQSISALNLSFPLTRAYSLKSRGQSLGVCGGSRPATVETNTGCCCAKPPSQTTRGRELKLDAHAEHTDVSDCQISTYFIYFPVVINSL